MKKIETLRKELETINNNDLAAMIGNSKNVDVESLSDKEKLCILIYNEYAKSLNNKSTQILLNCDCADAKDTTTSTDYFKILDSENRSIARCYIHVKKNSVTTDLRFTARKKILEREDDIKALQFVTYRYPEGSKNAGKARNCERQAIPYDEFIRVAKAIVPILLDTKVTAKKIEEEAPVKKTAKKTAKKVAPVETVAE